VSKRPEPEHWSGKGTRERGALDLEAGVFTLDDPEAIAASLARSAEASDRRRADPFRSAMAMLTFYLNRAGDRLPEARRRVLEEAKDALRERYGRPRRNDRALRRRRAASAAARAGPPRRGGRGPCRG
jgi:hypothetical protein